jgi:hypothetical protein
MRRLRSFAAQSPAIVISTVALLLSLGGGAYAATVLNGSQIAPRSIPANRIVDHSIGALQLQAAAPIAWHKLRLLHGWAPSQGTFGTGVPRYAVRDGIAYLSGSLHGGSGGSSAFAVLPRSARPNHFLFITVYTFQGAAGALEIDPTGAMFLFNGPAAGDTAGFSSLAAISYPVTS